MKNALKFRVYATLLVCVMMTSCGLFKRKMISNTQVKHVKKDSSHVTGKRHIPVKSNDVLVEKKKEPVAPSVADPASSPPVIVPPVTKTIDGVVPLPPTLVEKTFNSNFPSATSVVWTKVKPSLGGISTTGFRANFQLQHVKNEVIYDESGSLLEMREEILPEQLPPTVYNAIKTQYPSVYILSATAFKKSHINGSYAAIILPYAQSEHIEVILMENGTFVK